MKLKTISILLLLCGYALAQQEINGYRIYDNVAAPATPASGKTTVYVDSTLKQLCTKDDAGNVNCLTLPPGTIVNSTNITFPGAVTVGTTVLTQYGPSVNGIDPLLNPATISNSCTPAAFNNGKYNAWGITVKFRSGKWAVIYREGTSHGDDAGVIRMMTSADQGCTWGSPVTIQSDSANGNDLENIGGGLSLDNRLVISFVRYNISGASYVDMRYIYSEDEGSSFSTSVALPTPTGAAVFSTYGNMVPVGSTLLMPLYSWVTSPSVVYSTWTVRSADGGKTWGSLTKIGDDSSSHVGITETSIAPLGGNTVLAVSRENLTPFGLRQYLSIDGGATYTDQGNLSFDAEHHGAPQLVPYVDGGQLQVMLYANKYTNGAALVAVSGPAASIIAGPSGWDATTLTSLGSLGDSSGYPAMIHPYGTPYSFGWFYSAVYPGDTQTNMVFVRGPFQPKPMRPVLSGLFTAGTAYYQGSGGLAQAKADASATLPGICLAIASTNCMFNGVYQYSSSQSWTVGGAIYVSDASAGALTQTAPSTLGHFVQPVGVALAADTILWAPSLTASPSAGARTLLSGFPVSATRDNYTPATNTTGASLIVVFCGSTASSCTIHDSASNTWTAATSYGSGTPRAQFYYDYAPNTSATHTFEPYITTDSFIVVWAFSGTLTTASVFDSQNGVAASGASSFQTGSVTPSVPGAIVLAGATSNGTLSSLSINSGFSPPVTNTDTSAYESGGASYLISTTATATNPTFTANTNTDWTAAIIVFK